MDITIYQKKPRQVGGYLFDGSLQSAKDVQEWVQAASGLTPTITPSTLSDGTPGYAIYVPSVNGTNLLTAGMTLLQDTPTNYYPISPDELARNYEESNTSTA